MAKEAKFEENLKELETIIKELENLEQINHKKGK